MGGKANLSKQEIDDILKFGTEELFKEEEGVNEDGESPNDIVYDDAAVAALLDRSQEGVEEKEAGPMNISTVSRLQRMQPRKVGRRRRRLRY